MGLAGESGCGKSTLGNSLIFMEGRMQHLGGRVWSTGSTPDQDFRGHAALPDGQGLAGPAVRDDALNPTRRISKLTTDLLRSHGVERPTCWMR